MLEIKQVVLMKIESVYNTDPVPAPATDAFITGPVTWGIKDGSIARKVVLSYFGAISKVPLGTGIDISFQCELFGSGTKDVAPKPQGLLMRAAGFSETINAGTSVVYNELTQQDVESLTMYWYNDGILYKASGLIVDSIKFNLDANKICLMDVKLSGIFAGVSAITDMAMATPTLGAPQIPPVLQNASFTFDSYAGAISKCELIIANKNAARPDPNSASGVKRVSIVDRDIKGSVDPEMTALATYNPWALWTAGTSGALSITLGGTTGNKYTFACPYCDHTLPKIGARSGIRTYALAFDSVPTLAAGNNRLTLSHL